MLPAAHRLRLGRDITRVYRRGRYGNGNVLSIKALATGGGESRVAIVVAKKIARRAVVRNRIRRRLAEQLRTNWQTVMPGYDIVVTVHQDISAAPTAELATALATALRQSGCYLQEK